TSTVATGTAPLVVTSTTPVANLSIGGNAATATTTISFTGSISGDVTGTQSATTIATGAVNSAKIADGTIVDADISTTASISLSKLSNSGASSGQIIKYNGTNWAASNNSVSAITTISTTTTLTSVMDTILCDNWSSAFTITLPTASSNTGKILVIRKIDESTNVLTITPAINLTKSGASTYSTLSSLNYPKTLRIQSDGTNWWLID
ncbi:hypothetical protein CLV55_1019, partial [Flavobacterium aciduliphilum]